MATPRVFLSSTCYDLDEVRDSLYSFIEGLGYIPVFSDKNDVFYHPDLHSHESCIKEIENCQFFILLIGGRFGGNYVYDTSKSIVNAEYQTAKKLNLPIFTFIKREVHEDHRVFIRNKKNNPKYFDKIIYPSIEKQETVVNIFNFIDEVRRSDKNNAYFTFEHSKDIREILIKQLAGMFYDLLWKRQKEVDNSKTEELLSNLSLLGQKTEEIIENIYKKVDENSAATEIKKLDLIFNASKFWQTLSKKFNLNTPSNKDRIIELAEIEEDNFIDYLVSKGKFRVDEYLNSNGIKQKGLTKLNEKLYLPLEVEEGEIPEGHIKTVNNLESYFKSFKELNKNDRIKVIQNIA